MLKPKRTFILFLIAVVGQLSLAAIPYRGQNVPTPAPEAVAIQNLRGSLDSIRHGQKNHENELRVFSEKFENIEIIIDALRDQLRDNSKAYKENHNLLSAEIENKISALELEAKSAVADLGQLKEHANETSRVLEQYQRLLRDLEKASQQQAQQISNLQAALKAVTEILGKESDDSTVKIYRVKAGDSLEKIAHAHQTSIKSIKELNNLSNDRIMINQKLKLPDK